MDHRSSTSPGTRRRAGRIALSEQVQSPQRESVSDGVGKQARCTAAAGVSSTTDLDTLLIALYVKIDDLLAGIRRVGRPPRLTDTELVCLAVAQALLGYRSEPRWLRACYRRLGHLFPYLPKRTADRIG
jgi:hypothetical protein